MDPRTFRDIAGRFATGVTVITTIDSSGNPVGMTVNSFTSLSLDPLLVLFNIDKKATLYDEFMKTESFGVNILCREQEELSNHFSKRGIDRFDGVTYTQDVTGAPILNGVLAYIDCTVTKRFEGGDHTIVLGEVQGGQWYDKEPLLFYGGKYMIPSLP